MPKLPLEKPFTKNIYGTKARFWIRKWGDWKRIVGKDFEKEFGKILIKTISSMKNPCFWDIGAAQGLYSILAAKRGANVIAIDPDPESVKSLEENIDLNADIKDKIRIIPFALGGKDNHVTIFFNKVGGRAASLRKSQKLESKHSVLMYRTDTLISTLKIPCPSVIKLDVEGAENNVLRGAERLLTQDPKPDHIFIEIHPDFLPDFGSSIQEVVDVLRKYGYSPVSNQERGNELLCHYEKNDLRK